MIAPPCHHLPHLDQICQRRPESGEDQLGARHVGNEASFVDPLAHTCTYCLWLMTFNHSPSNVRKSWTCCLCKIWAMVSEKKRLPHGVPSRQECHRCCKWLGLVGAFSFSISDSLYDHIPTTPQCFPLQKTRCPRRFFCFGIAQL